jgi:antiphage defense system Thoeris ThsB-like protein
MGSDDKARLIAALAFGSLSPPPTILGSAGSPTRPSTIVGSASPAAPRPGLAAFRPRPNPAANTILGRALLKRKVYFAFDFDDLMRTNNVRQAWKIHHPGSALNRSFYDRSIWESRNIENDEALKGLMRGAIKYSSAVCVLVGTDTWRSRWVKYEISRAVVDERGLLAVHINGLNHIERRAPDPLGYNPLEVMGIFRSASDRYYLYEKNVVVDPTNGQLGWEWRKYEDYTDPVPLPPYLPPVGVNLVMPLTWATRAYDYVAELGHKNIGAWIDSAAVAAGR